MEIKIKIANDVSLDEFGAFLVDLHAYLVSTEDKRAIVKDVEVN